MRLYVGRSTQSIVGVELHLVRIRDGDVWTPQHIPVDSSAGVEARMERGCDCTHRFARVLILDKGDPRGLPRSRPDCHGRENRASTSCQIYEGVPRARYMAFGSILHIRCTETMKRDALLHGWMEIANVKTVLEQLAQPFLKGKEKHILLMITGRERAEQ